MVAVGLPHHITQRGNARQDVFTTDSIRHAYLKLLSEHAAGNGLRLLAYCLMTNHVHVVAVPTNASSMANTLRHAHGRFSQAWNTLENRTGHVWQNRYYSCPVEEMEVGRVLAYVENNPVRAGIVGCAENLHGPARELTWAKEPPGRCSTWNGGNSVGIRRIGKPCFTIVNPSPHCGLSARRPIQGDLWGRSSSSSDYRKNWGESCTPVREEQKRGLRMMTSCIFGVGNNNDRHNAGTVSSVPSILSRTGVTLNGQTASRECGQNGDPPR